jgi:hypothetical protein
MLCTIEIVDKMCNRRFAKNLHLASRATGFTRAADRGRD